jgi:hypothetical protein
MKDIKEISNILGPFEIPIRGVLLNGYRLEKGVIYVNTHSRKATRSCRLVQVLEGAARSVQMGAGYTTL